MMIGGQSIGMLSNNTRKASVPPVEAPMAMIFSVVRSMAEPVGFGSIASADSLGATCVVGCTILTLARAAASTVSRIRCAPSSRNCFTPNSGLAMISTAPEASAANKVSDFSETREEQITTGIGCCPISFFRKVTPSMRGISTSRTMTSGIMWRNFSAAAKGSPTAAIT